MRRYFGIFRPKWSSLLDANPAKNGKRTVTAAERRLNALGLCYICGMTTTTLTIRIDETVKRAARARADRLGISMGSLVENELRRFINGQPVIIDDDSSVPTKRLLKELEEAQAEYEHGNTTSVPASEIGTYLDSPTQDRQEENPSSPRHNSR